jgi:hypothetical protein
MFMNLKAGGLKIGSGTYYKKVKRVTIALENKDYSILMVSFDIICNHEHIVMNKYFHL